MRSFDANSSFERPGDDELAVDKRHVGDRFHPRIALLSGGAAAGAFGSVAFVIFRPSSATTSILPAPSTRKSAGFASAPVPRMTEMNAFSRLRDARRDR